MRERFPAEVGVCKPAPEIYRDCLDRLGITPRKFCFWTTVSPMSALRRTSGLHAILFTTPSKAAQEMERTLRSP